ncbi:MAG TPA: Gfo/Idh/MocA family oxidoreductase [Candidatus Methylomirabilis sp.]
MTRNGALKDTPLRIAFAGAGTISAYHLTGWKQTPGVELVAICDAVLEKARTRAIEFGVSRAYTDFATMLDKEKPDAVDIVTPVETHAPLARIAADRGVHVMCQKPMVPTLAEAEALVRDVGDRVRFMVHENFRFRPQYVTAREWLEAGRVGDPTHACMTARSSGFLSLGGTTPFLLQRQPYLQAFPRLLIFEALIHHLDVLRFLLGPLMVVSAQVAKINQGLTGEDAASILLRGENGPICVLDGNFSAPGYPALPMDRLEISGTKGTLLFEEDRLSLVGGDEPPIAFDLQQSYQAGFTNAIQAFVHGLRTDEPFQTDRLDNLETLKLMEFCYVAAGVPF